MSLTLTAILLFGAAGLLYSAWLPPRWRGRFLLLASVAAIFWLQPPLPIRFSDYILPALTIGLAVGGWWVTRQPADPAQAASWPEDRRTLVLIAAALIALALMRYVDDTMRLTASRPPAPLWVAVTLGALALVLAAPAQALSRRLLETRTRRRVLLGFMVLILLLFVLLKSAPLATAVSAWWRSLTNQDVSLASPIDLGWLGFSYVAFRLLHTLRDRQTGLLPVLTLREYLSYIIFFPAYVAGPIDRAERFMQDWRALPDLAGWDPARLTLAGQRIALGLVKKFVIADTLAQGMSLTPATAAESEATLWLWILLYGYALRLYLDFAGYTDIAIGLGLLFGLRLPENFRRPYTQTSITAFWQSWHITLSDWARFYVFTPLSRWLLTRPRRPSSTAIVLTAQLATMLTIGLWHGVTWNFFVWGLWHGLGLFIHKQWSDRTRAWYRRLRGRRWAFRAWRLSAGLLTFHFVILGWVWFALPSLSASLTVLARLFGGAG